MCWQGASCERGTSGGGCAWEQPPRGSGAAGDLGGLSSAPAEGSALEPWGRQRLQPSHQLPIAGAASPRTGPHSSPVWNTLCPTGAVQEPRVGCAGPWPGGEVLRAVAWRTGSHLTAWQLERCPELEHPARSSRAVGSRCSGAMSHSYLATGSSSGSGCLQRLARGVQRAGTPAPAGAASGTVPPTVTHSPATRARPALVGASAVDLPPQPRNPPMPPVSPRSCRRAAVPDTTRGSACCGPGLLARPGVPVPRPSPRCPRRRRPSAPRTAAPGWGHGGRRTGDREPYRGREVARPTGAG